VGSPIDSPDVKKKKQKKKRPGTPRPGNGGRRAGAGAKPFIPTDEQRNVVKLAVAEGISQERIARLIRNPMTQQPISVDTLVIAFAHELDTGYLEAQMVVGVSLMSMVRAKNLGAVVWWDKTRGRRIEAMNEKVDPKTDPAGSTVKHVIEIVHGFPADDDGGPDEET